MLKSARCRWLPVIGIVLATHLDAARAQTPADDPLTVRLHSGRTFTGTVDGRTDQVRLWLRTDTGVIVVARPIAWERVASARRNGQDVDLAALRVAAPALAYDSPSTTPYQVTFTPPAGQPTPANDEFIAPLLAADEPPPLLVCSLQIDVYAANWDADVEVDGLVVHVCPQSCFGQLVPIDGTLNVDLVGQQLGAVWDQQPFPILGRWSQAVRIEDFGPTGAVYRFPFQAVHPEFDLSVSSIGLVHARLLAPGQGSFDASQSTVRVRPYSSVRDRLQRRWGERFLPGERTGRGS